jgi:hypothetical protein
LAETVRFTIHLLTEKRTREEESVTDPN